MSNSVQSFEKFNSNQPAHIYYSTDIINNTTTGDNNPVPLIFSDIRNADILGCCENYFCSIVRFSIDTGPSLPIFIPQILVGQANVNKTVYNITMTYKTFSATEAIIYVPTDVTQPTPAAPLTGVDYSSDYYLMFSYQKWLKYVNTCLATCLNSLNTAVVAGGDVLPISLLNIPFMEIDPVNLTCIFNADALGFNASLANPINIYFNTALYSLYTFFQYTRYGPTASNGKNYLLNIYFNNNNSTITNVGGTTYTALQMYQEGSSSALMNPIESIVFTTTLPIVTENIGIPIVYNSTTTTNSGGNPNSSPILSDFQVPFSALNNYRPTIEYSPTSEYRLVDMFGSGALNNIQLNVYWKDKFANLRPIMLSAGCGASVKLMFRRKDYFSAKLY